MMRWILMALSAFVLSSCGDAYPKLKKLDHGYVYWIATPDLIFIIQGDPNGPNSSIIPESIDLVAQQEDWIFGHVTPYPKELAGSRTPDSEGGYFHLNLATDEFRLGLSEEDWRSYLASRGVKSPLRRLNSRL